MRDSTSFAQRIEKAMAFQTANVIDESYEPKA